jgi:cytochrome oxidase Cu insertion factor (SCO1/SenC/PrrC family)
MRKLFLPALLAAVLPLTAQSTAAAPAANASAPKPPAIPAVGAMAPGFSLPDETGTMRTLSALKGQPLLIAFYPRDFTGG